MRPALPGIDDVPTLDNVSIMALDRVPEHLVIVGGSYIGLEFAQLMRRFGAEVTVVERSAHLLPREDDDVADGIRAILEAEGVRFELGAECICAGARRRAHRGRRQVRRRRAGDRRQPCAAGGRAAAQHRRPGAGHAPASRTDERGYIAVDDQCRSSAEGVWAVGDCNGRGAFTHTAWNDHEIVVANLFDNDPRRISDRIPCYALFIDPPLGRVGRPKPKCAGRRRARRCAPRCRCSASAARARPARRRAS